MRVTAWRVWGAVGIVPLLIGPAVLAQEKELVIFDFEGDLQEWSIPAWAQAAADHVGSNLSPSQDFVSHGKGSLQLDVDFPGQGQWTAAYIEREMYVTDWSPFGAIAVDVYLPYHVLKGLKGRIILTVGEKWEWAEMNRAIPLKPDQWTTITANLKPGSLDWKFFPEEGFRKDVRKVGIRIESDREPAYRGLVFIDTVRLIK